MGTYKGKVIGIKLNTQKTSSAGKPFMAHLLKINTDTGEETFTIAVKMPPAKFVEKLAKGDDVEVMTGGQFNSVVKVSKAGFQKKEYGGKSSFGSSFPKKEYKDNTAGMIKGNAVSNGVALAIARHGSETTLAHIEEAAREILLLHAKLENEQLPKVDSLNETKQDDVPFDTDDDVFGEKEEDIDF